MDILQARMFIEQVLNMPTIPLAAQYVQANVRLLDDTFFAVLVQMIQEEQMSGGESWGASFEDRIAEFMARGGQSAGSSQRLQALQMLYNYAMQLRPQMAVRPSSGASTVGQLRPMTVTCARCGRTQPILCPGSGLHPPSPTVAHGPNGPQCLVCGAMFAYATCACGYVTHFTSQAFGMTREEDEEENGGSVQPSSGMGETERTSQIEGLKRMVQDLMGSGKMTPEVLEQLMSTTDPEVLDAINSELEAQGAHEIGSGPPLNIGDFYREGRGKFKLQWTLSTSVEGMLPVPFAQLDRKTQFYVLFGEWSRRELEGMSALNSGQVDQAETIFQECLQRAEQLEVSELLARSYEGLMRVAQKRSNRQAESEWSKKAMEARAG